MPYTNEERIEYNKKYYADNKARIATMLLTKLECPCCHKMITKANIERHTKSNICIKRQTKQSQSNNNYDDLQKQINDLTAQLATLKKD